MLGRTLIAFQNEFIEQQKAYNVNDKKRNIFSSLFAVWNSSLIPFREMYLLRFFLLSLLRVSIFLMKNSNRNGSPNYLYVFITDDYENFPLFYFLKYKNFANRISHIGVFGLNSVFCVFAFSIYSSFFFYLSLAKFFELSLGCHLIQILAYTTV